MELILMDKNAVEIPRDSMTKVLIGNLEVSK